MTRSRHLGALCLFIYIMHTDNSDASAVGAVRAKRQASAGSSMLTVQWEGIQSRADQDVIKGFRVEYRAEHERQWTQHRGLIEFKGPQAQYSVTIKDLPSGIIYYVRIIVIGQNGQTLVSTSEIRAETTTYIDCSDDSITAPRNLAVIRQSDFAVAFGWEAPECGGDGLQFEYELIGLGEYAAFDLHTGKTSVPSVQIANLMPGTSYQLRVRGVDGSTQQLGQWSDGITASTRGNPPSHESKLDASYRDSTQIRVNWDVPATAGGKVHHYEVMMIEVSGATGTKVSEARLPPSQTSYLFTNLKPNTEYKVGILAFVDNQPRHVYQVKVETSATDSSVWTSQPSVQKSSDGSFVVYWDTPPQFEQQNLHYFVVEYKLPDQSEWRRYKQEIRYKPGQSKYQVAVDGLSNRVYYEMRVFAVDRGGETVSKTAQFSVGEAAQGSCSGIAGTPTQVRVDYSTHDTITISWQQPRCDESFGPIEAYEYKCWNVDSASEQTAPIEQATGTRTTISDLMPNARYAVRVRARSRAGNSPWGALVYTNTKSSATQTHTGGSGASSGSGADSGAYNLRVILSSPSSYLTWSPLPEHLNNIARFRLSYKLTSDGEWRKVEESSRFFQCPRGIGQTGDYCYALNDFRRGVQYTAQVVYQLTNQEWTDEGNPLFFILVEAERPNIPVAPNGFHIVFVNSTAINLAWLPPLFDGTPVQQYKIFVRVLSSSNPRMQAGATQQYEVPGNQFSYTVNGLTQNTVYNVSVQAGTAQGFLGPAAYETISTGKGSLRPQIGRIDVTQRDGIVHLKWEATGNLRGLCCFQIDYRAEREQNWTPGGTLVAVRPTDNQYDTDVHNLQGNSRYFLRIRILDRSRQEVHASEAVSLTTQCQAPSLPPTGLTIKADPDSRIVILSWTPPARTSWNCDRVSYLIEGNAGKQPISINVPSAPRDFRVEHRADYIPGADWSVSVRTVTTGGKSTPSQLATLQTQQEAPKTSTRSQIGTGNQNRKPRAKQGVVCWPAGDSWQCSGKEDSDGTTTAPTPPPALVIGPRVSAEGSNLRVDWQSKGYSEGIYAYRVEFRTPTGRWTPYGNVVAFRGEGQQYSQTLTGLTIGDTYYVRVQVLDRSQSIIFTSPEASAIIQCQPPREPPRNVRISAPDPSHVRVTWELPPASAWNCAGVQVELEVVEPASTQPPRTFNQDQSTHVFDSRPNERWAVRMRTLNNGGKSQWSSPAQVRTSPAGELIINFRSTSDRNGMSLTWQSVAGMHDLVAYYQVYYSYDNRDWTALPSGRIPFTGDQHAYVVPLRDLPEGRTIFARVKVIDFNNGEAFTSSPISVEIPSKCRAPSSSPQGLTVQGMGPSQIRVSWQPLERRQWNCDKVWYILKFSNPTAEGVKNLTDRDNMADFDSQPFTEWTFKILAENSAGRSGWSETQKGSTLEGTPGSVRGLTHYPLGPGTVQLNWQQPDTPNGRINSYEITYQLMSKGMCTQQPEQRVTVNTMNPSKTTHQLDGLHPHSKYRVTVAAKTTVVGEPAQLELTTDTQPPKAPPRSIIARSNTPNSATINWQEPACLDTNGDISEYEYELRGVDTWATGELHQQSTRDTAAEIPGLTPFTTYKLRLRAFTTKGPGPWSMEQTVRTKPADRPTKPARITIIDTKPRSISIMWEAPYPPMGDLDEYKVRFALSRTNQWQDRKFPASGVICDRGTLQAQRVFDQTKKHYCAVIDSLMPEQLYEFQVSAHMVNSDWGAWSDAESARTGSGPVQVLDVHKVGGDSSSCEIKWAVGASDRPRVIGFKIMATPTGMVQVRPQSWEVDGNTYQYRIENLKSNTDYNVSVEARTQSGYHPGRSTVIHTDEESVPAMTYPPRVVEARSSHIVFEWNSPIDGRAVEYYELEYRRTGQNQAWQQHERVRHTQGSRTFQTTVRHLEPNEEIEARVKAVGARDRHGESSATVNARTECDKPQMPPQGVRVDSPSSTDIRVTWGRPAKSTWGCDHVDYELWYQVVGEAPKTIPISSEQTEYTFAAQPHTKWTFKLRTKNTVGTSDWTANTEITTKQDRPGQVRSLLLDPRSPNTVYAQWIEPQDKQGVIVGYDVSYRLKHRVACPDEEPRDVTRDWITVYNVKDNDYMITGLLPNSEYEVRVQARTTELGSAVSKTVRTASTPPSAPPLDLVLSYKLERSLNFKWDLVECSQRHGVITNYEYELLGLDNWAKLQRQIANTTSQDIVIEGLVPFTKYLLRVKAYNSAGGGPNTENLEVQTSQAEAPLKPQDLVVMQEGTSFFAVSWIAPYPPYGPLEAFKVRYKKVSFRGDTDWVVTEMKVDDPRLSCREDQPNYRECFNVTGQNPGEQFKVQVAGKIENGNYGPWCEVIIANTLEILPGAPKSIGLREKSDNSLKIWWEGPLDMPERVSQYKVSVLPCDAPANADPKTFMVDGKIYEYRFDNLDPDTCYNVTVNAGTSRGFGPGRSTQMNTDPFEVPTVGTAPTVTPYGSDTLNVEWPGVMDPTSRILGYILEFRAADTPTWQPFGEMVPHDNVKRQYFEKISGLEPDTTYLVRVKVVDKNKRNSEPSPQAEGRTGCSKPESPPGSPRLESPNAREVRITWIAPPTYTWRCSSIKYRLEYKNGTLTGWQSMNYPGDTVEARFESRPFTKWSMRVRTENDVGHSEYTEEVSIQTPQAAPGAVTNVDAKETGPETVTVTWKEPIEPNGNIGGYVVVYRMKSKGDCAVPPSQPIVREVVSEKIDLEGLEPDTTYEVVVKARTNKEGPPSEPTLVTTSEAKPTGAPERTKVVTTNRERASFDWESPACGERNGDITEYEYEVEALDDWVRKDEQKTDGKTRQEKADVNELVAYTRYQFRVRALNKKGAGPFGDWIEFQTRPGPPPSPRDLVEDEIQSSAVKISFLAPSPPSGELDEYRIRHTIAGRVSWKEVRVPPSQLACQDGSSRLCYRIAEMEPETEYKIEVAAHTRDGDWGEWTPSLKVQTGEMVIPALDGHLRVEEQSPDSLELTFEGLDPEKTKNVLGYVIECSEQGGKWTQRGKLVPVSRTSDRKHTVRVGDLDPDTSYFCRVRVSAKNGKNGPPGPEDQVETTCGEPTSPPRNVELSSEDFKTIQVTWNPPSRESWLCSHVAYILSFDNGTKDGQIDIGFNEPATYSFDTLPGTTWTVKMSTQALENDGQTKGRVSEWSPEAVHTIRVPGNMFVYVKPEGPEELDVHWEMPPEDKAWKYGVDVTYRLKQHGNCEEVENAKPITKYNQQGSNVVLKNLDPYSLYEITVKPRAPSDGIKTPITKEDKRTAEKVPSGPPTNVRNEEQTRDSLQFRWEKPECDKQNGEITQYEYELIGLDEWVQDVKMSSATSREHSLVNDLVPGTLYRFKVRAYTAEGAGPWSDSVDVRTGGSEIGPPKGLRAVDNGAHYAVLTWLPPSPLRGAVTGYKLSYSNKLESRKPTIVDLKNEDLSCNKYLGAPLITSESRCYKLENLDAEATYTTMVQARAESGNWGDWSNKFFVTTNKPAGELSGQLKTTAITHDTITLQWKVPEPLKKTVDGYKLRIKPTYSESAELPDEHELAQDKTDYLFRGLKPVTSYNITVEASADDRVVWSGSTIATTTDISSGPLEWLAAPTNLQLLKKTHEEMEVEWDMPEILLPSHQQLVTNYQVTIAEFDPDTKITGPKKRYTVPVPSQRINFENLKPESVYNITVTACTHNGCGGTLWGSYSTLPYPGKPHVLSLVYRTPWSLRLKWKQQWGENMKDGYTLTAQPLFSLTPGINMQKIIAVDNVPGDQNEYTIDKLHPSTIYNVTLKPNNYRGDYIPAWGAYNTLPPGALVVGNLRSCKRTEFAISLSWTHLVIGNPDAEIVEATKYRFRYTKATLKTWVKYDEKSAHELRCPGDPCDKKCFLLYNLEGPTNDYTVQVSAYINNEWHRWKTVAMNAPADPNSIREKACCIVPPDYYLATVNGPGTIREIIIKPVPNDTNILRYYVVADTRPDRGEINSTMLTDRLTAQKLGIGYYVAGSFDKTTLTKERKFPVGDGEVYGGYLNYPLEKGIDYDFPFMALWWFEDKPVVGWWRDSRDLMVAGWPWWWLLLLLLLLLLLILLCCCCFYLWRSKYRKKRGYVYGTGRSMNSAAVGASDAEAQKLIDLRNLNSRIDNIAQKLDGSGSFVGHLVARFDSGYQFSERDEYDGATSSRPGQGVAGSLYGERSSSYYRPPIHRDHYYISKSGFEDGYVHGFRDANKVGSAGDARDRMDGEYRNKEGEFHTGYVQGLRDAGMTGMSTSMHNLAAKTQGSGYSSGYMQGFRDGDAGMFGDRITTTLLHRLEEQYPNQEDFRHGYVEGYKDGVGSRTQTTHNKEDTRVSENINKISERLQTLEKVKGDEIHSTKIYHVYNQSPEGFSAAGQQLGYELDESRRSTMRKHYTPGDYMRYGTPTDGYPTNTLRRSQRSMSAAALGREDDRFMHTTPPRQPRQSGGYTGTLNRSERNYGTVDSRNSQRYQYRSRSDLGAAQGRRYGSTTLLDGRRPGPVPPSSGGQAAPAWRRDALETLQRELDVISRSPTSPTTGGVPLRRPPNELARGYSSDTGYMNDTWKSQRSARELDFDQYQTSEQSSRMHQQQTTTTMSTGQGAFVGSHAIQATPSRYRVGNNVAKSPTEARSGGSDAPGGGHALAAAYNLVGLAGSSSGGAVGTGTGAGARPATAVHPPTSAGQPTVPASYGMSETSSQHQQQAQIHEHRAHSNAPSASHEWPDNLMDIVQEPMGQTLDRMKKYNSVGQAMPTEDDRQTTSSIPNVKESVQESYSQSYKEEYTTEP